MPGSKPISSITTIAHAGGTLRFAGPLTRAHIAPLWSQLPKGFDGTHAFDLTAVERIDSAGLALLSLLAARCDAVSIIGSPPGLVELRAAYRLAPSLAFAA